MIIVDQLQISTAAFPIVVRGKSVYFQLEFSGGNPGASKTWSIATDTPNQLPSGLTLNPSGVVQGQTNDPAGNYPVKFEVTDGQQIATKEL